MEQELKFKDSLNFWQDLFHEQRVLFVLFVIFILISIISFWAFLAIHPAFILFAVGFFVFALMVTAAFLLNHFMAKNNIVLKESGLTIPAFDFGNRSLRAISDEGYFYDSKWNDFSLLSSYSNIKRAWRITDKKEQKALSINKNLFNTKEWVDIGILSFDVKNIYSIIKNWKENDKLYDNLIKKCFIHKYVTDPSMAVGIEFKELKFRYPEMLKWENKIPFSKTIKSVLYNDFKDIVVYVSVVEPDKLVKELNSKIKK